MSILNLEEQIVHLYNTDRKKLTEFLREKLTEIYPISEEQAVKLVELCDDYVPSDIVEIAAVLDILYPQQRRFFTFRQNGSCTEGIESNDRIAEYVIIEANDATHANEIAASFLNFRAYACACGEEGCGGDLRMWYQVEDDTVGTSVPMGSDGYYGDCPIEAAISGAKKGDVYAHVYHLDGSRVSFVK